MLLETFSKKTDGTVALAGSYVTGGIGVLNAALSESGEL